MKTRECRAKIHEGKSCAHSMLMRRERVVDLYVLFDAGGTNERERERKGVRVGVERGEKGIPYIRCERICLWVTV